MAYELVLFAAKNSWDALNYFLTFKKKVKMSQISHAAFISFNH